jgi:hypothetical protein
MMVSSTFVDTAAKVGLPAPHWFIQFFKVLGFTLHAVPMNLWYAGLLLAVCLHLSRNQHGRLFASRLIGQMPIIIAVGVNLGIVPLLFIQLAYFKFFYPATILMAWFWLAVIILLIPAYYGVYVYAWELRKGKESIKGWRRAVGWVAAIFFIAMGFIFANAMSLMDHVDRWEEIWSNNNVAGAALGTGLNVGDATLWPRWLLMFGLALGTTAVWVLVDTTFFHRNAVVEYKRWAWKLAKILYTVGMIWAAAAGTWYVFGTWSEELRKTMFSSPAIVLTVLTALAPGLPWIMIVTERLCPAKNSLVAGIVLAQVGVLAVNAVSRQVVQNLNIAGVFDVFSQKIDVQWGPMTMFLAAFVIGLGILAWMLTQVIKASANRPR